MNEYKIAMGIVRKKNSYLIGKRASEKKFSPGKWEFISGFVDLNEKPEETIIRELKEETGMIGQVVRAGTPYFVIDKEGKWDVFPFLIEVNKGDFKINKKDHEQLRWVELSELEDYEDLIADIAHLKKDILSNNS